MHVNSFPQTIKYDKKKDRLFESSLILDIILMINYGSQCLSDGVLDSKLRGCGFEPHQRHCIVSFEHESATHMNPCLELVQPRKTGPEILLTGM